MKREKSLDISAKHNIEICCQTLCDKEIVQEYIQQLEEENKDLKQQVYNLTNKIHARMLAK